MFHEDYEAYDIEHFHFQRKRDDAFVCLGEYDYVTLRPAPDRRQVRGSLDHVPILQAKVFFHKPQNPSTADKASPIAWMWQDQQPPTVTHGLLIRYDLETPFGLKRPIDAQRDFADQFYVLAQKNRWQHACCFIGIGLCSIYAFVAIEADLKQQFDKAIQLANQQNQLSAEAKISSLFPYKIANTTTLVFGRPASIVPEQIANPKVLASMRAKVRLSKQAGAMQRVQQTLKLPAEHLSVLQGEDDLLATNIHCPLNELLGKIEQLLEADISTQTSLIFRDLNFLNAQPPQPAHGYPTTPLSGHPIYQNWSGGPIAEEQVWRDSCEFQDISSFVQPLLRALISDPEPSLFSQRAFQIIHRELGHLKNRKADKDERLPIFCERARATFEILQDAYIQRKSERINPARDHNLASTMLTTGTYLPLQALDNYAESLYRHMQGQVTLQDENHRKDNLPDWGGIVVASRQHGYAQLPHHIVIVPYAALLEPVSRFESWSTLSHEIAHGISSRLLNSDSAIKNAVEQACEVRIKLTHGGISKDQLKPNIDRDLREITAHWLDFRLAFGDQFDDYLASIWTTWSRGLQYNPRKLKDYHTRSFSVFLSHKNPDLIWEMHEQAMRSLEDYERLYDDFYKRIDGAFDSYASTCLTIPHIRDFQRMKEIDYGLSREVLLRTVTHLLPIFGSVMKAFVLPKTPKPHPVNQYLVGVQKYLSGAQNEPNFNQSLSRMLYIIDLLTMED